MREINTNTTTTSPNLPIWRWNSPTPYLFSAVILLMALIATALLMLACSYRKRPVSVSASALASASTAGDQMSWSETTVISANVERDTKPKIVVIMAGDDKPTFFAAPAQIQPAFNHICTCGSQV